MKSNEKIKDITAESHKSDGISKLQLIQLLVNTKSETRKQRFQVEEIYESNKNNSRKRKIKKERKKEIKESGKRELRRRCQIGNVGRERRGMSMNQREG